MGVSDGDSKVAAASELQQEAGEGQHFVVQMLEAFWRLHAARPHNAALAPTCLPGARYYHVEMCCVCDIV